MSPEALFMQDNYGVSASGKRSVKYMLKQMMEAGRLTQEGGFYKLAGFPQQMVEDSKRWAGEEVRHQSHRCDTMSASRTFLLEAECRRTMYLSKLLSGV